MRHKPKIFLVPIAVALVILICGLVYVTREQIADLAFRNVVSLWPNTMCFTTDGEKLVMVYGAKLIYKGDKAIGIQNSKAVAISWSPESGSGINPLKKPQIVFDLPTPSYYFVSATTSTILLGDIKNGEFITVNDRIFTAGVRTSLAATFPGSFVPSKSTFRFAPGGIVISGRTHIQGAMPVYSIRAFDVLHHRELWNQEFPGKHGRTEAYHSGSDTIITQMADAAVKNGDVISSGPYSIVHLTSNSSSPLAQIPMPFAQRTSISPDGRFAAGHTEKHFLWVYDCKNRKMLVHPDGAVEVGRVYAWSPDSTLFGEGGDGTITLWNTQTWTPTSHVPLDPERMILALVFSPDSKYLVVGDDQKIQAFPVENVQISNSPKIILRNAAVDF